MLSEVVSISPIRTLIIFPARITIGKSWTLFVMELTEILGFKLVFITKWKRDVNGSFSIFLSEVGVKATFHSNASLKEVKRF